MIDELARMSKIRPYRDHPLSLLAWHPLSVLRHEPFLTIRPVGLHRTSLVGIQREENLELLGFRGDLLPLGVRALVWRP